MIAILELHNVFGYKTVIQFPIEPDLLIDTQVNRIARNYPTTSEAILITRMYGRTIKETKYQRDNSTYGVNQQFTLVREG
jgi:hypothetical protein